jgi:hypothetical protein
VRQHAQVLTLHPELTVTASVTQRCALARRLRSCVLVQAVRCTYSAAVLEHCTYPTTLLLLLLLCTLLALLQEQDGRAQPPKAGLRGGRGESVNGFTNGYGNGYGNGHSSRLTAGWNEEPDSSFDSGSGSSSSAAAAAAAAAAAGGSTDHMRQAVFGRQAAPTTPVSAAHQYLCLKHIHHIHVYMYMYISVVLMSILHKQSLPCTQCSVCRSLPFRTLSIIVLRSALSLLQPLC